MTVRGRRVARLSRVGATDPLAGVDRCTVLEWSHRTGYCFPARCWGRRCGSRWPPSCDVAATPCRPSVSHRPRRKHPTTCCSTCCRRSRAIGTWFCCRTATPVCTSPHWRNRGERCVVGAVFVDAGLPPRDGEVPLAPPELFASLADKVNSDGLLPPWTSWWDEADVAGLSPTPEVRAPRHAPSGCGVQRRRSPEADAPATHGRRSGRTVDRDCEGGTDLAHAGLGHSPQAFDEDRDRDAFDRVEIDG